MKTLSPEFQSLLDSLTLAQAQTWESLTDKWVYIDDYILSPANIRDNSFTIHAVEDRFAELLND